MKGGGI